MDVQPAEPGPSSFAALAWGSGFWARGWLGFLGFGLGVASGSWSGSWLGVLGFWAFGLGLAEGWLGGSGSGFWLGVGLGFWVGFSCLGVLGWHPKLQKEMPHNNEMHPKPPKNKSFSIETKLRNQTKNRFLLSSDRSV